MSLWPLALGVTTAAVAAGTLAVPAARHSILGSVEFDWQGRELELDRIDPDGMTVRLKSGAAMRVYRLAGLSYDTRPEAEQTALSEARAAFYHASAKAGVTVRLFGVKRRRAVHHPATWPTSALTEIGNAEQELYRNAFELRWYLTTQADELRRIEEADEKIVTILAPYGMRRLARPSQPEADCPLTGFLNFLACGDLRDDLRAISSNISANLPSADLVFEKDGTFLANVPTLHHHKVIAVRAWPDLVSGHLLHDLMALPFEIEVSHVLVPVNRDLDVILLKRAAENPFSADLAREECAAAVEMLTEGKASRLVTQMAVILRSPSPAELGEATAQVSRILADRRVSYSIETRGVPVVWYNRLPEHKPRRTKKKKVKSSGAHLFRPLKLDTDNIGALWPFEGAPSGLIRSQWLDVPVRSFQTGSGQPYAFQFQCTPADKALGNYVVFAPAGSGKSTLIMHLLGGLAKAAGVPSYIFDSKEGTRYMVETMGGVYQSFDRLELNPLDVADSPVTRQRLALLLRSMMGEAGTAEGIEETINLVLNTAFQIDPPNRTFDQIFELTFARETAARTAFSRWVTDAKSRAGLYARIFNAPRDGLAGFLDRFMVGINMNEALEDPDLGPPVVAHIATTIERIARTGQARGFAIFIDEAANLLRNPAFRDLAAVMYREYRKFGGAVGMAFQDPGALHKSGIADAVLENTASLFFFPNPQGNRAAYERFNLNDEQRAFIFGAPEGRKVLLVKRDAATGFEESVILDIDLSPLGRALRYYRSGPEAVRDLQKLQTEWGDQWPQHL